MIKSQGTETIVRQRYALGARERADQLCFPVDYESAYLSVIPQEVIDRDYGCGDPSRYLRAGETILDLGSGTGKICFIAAQIVGPKGKVIGAKGQDYDVTMEANSKCRDGGSCC
jgi:SAM-dependent methyltransferase